MIIDDSPFHPAVIEGVERQAKAMGLETVFNHVDVHDLEYGSQIQEILADTESAGPYSWAQRCWRKILKSFSRRKIALFFWMDGAISIFLIVF